MHVLVTGGNGLVGSNVVRRLLVERPDARASVLDLAPPDALGRAHLEPVAGRVAFVRGDLRDPAGLSAVEEPETVTQIVHAGAIAHVPAWELEDPEGLFAVNLGGTLAVLRWARTLPRLRRLVHVSTGGVYGEPGRWSPEAPQGEEGPFDPPELYAISKFAAERTVRRVGALHGIDVRAVRLSGVFGPMERPTAGRTLMSLPYAIARSLAAGRPLRLTHRTLEAGGDFLSVEDVAAGVTALLRASAPAHFAYNVAFGRFTPVREVLDVVTALAPAFRFTPVTESAGAEVDMDPADRRARWNAYAIERMATDTGWTPRPLAEQIDSYLRWLDADRATRSPPELPPPAGVDSGAQDR